MEKFTAQAPTKEEAISQGLNALNISREDAEITIIEEGRKGFLGIGQKDAIVTVSKKVSVASIFDEALNFEEAIVTEPQSKEAAREYDVEEVNEEPEGQLLNDSKSNTADTETENQRDNKEANLMIEPVRQFNEEAVEQVGPLSDEEVAQIDEAAIESVKEYIFSIGHALGVDEIEVNVYRELSNVYFDIKSNKPGLIIGRHGKVLDAIHTLSQIHLHNYAESKLFAQIDAENYRGRWKESLHGLADRTAEKVSRTKQPVILEAMPGKERKVIHHILSKNKDVKTHSEGQEPNRYLVVEPVLEQQSILDEQ